MQDAPNLVVENLPRNLDDPAAGLDVDSDEEVDLGDKINADPNENGDDDDDQSDQPRDGGTGTSCVGGFGVS